MKSFCYNKDKQITTSMQLQQLHEREGGALFMAAWITKAFLHIAKLIAKIFI